MHRQRGRESNSNKNKDGQERGAMEAIAKKKEEVVAKNTLYLYIYIHIFKIFLKRKKGKRGRLKGFRFGEVGKNLLKRSKKFPTKFSFIHKRNLNQSKWDWCIFPMIYGRYSPGIKGKQRGEGGQIFWESGH
jgi:hypothetical protein